MQIIHLDLKPIQADRVELRCFRENPAQYDSRPLLLSEIEPFLQQAEQSYYAASQKPLDLTAPGRRFELVQPWEEAGADTANWQTNLITLGRRLFQWLDGSDRWLVNQLSQALGETVVLAIAATEQLANLPWELLHDGAQFLVQRQPAVVPVRWLASDMVPQLTLDSQPRNRALNVLLMATSPLDVTPVLNYEQEEAQILKATTRFGIGLTVEESGCLEELRDLVASQPHDAFDVVHLTGHATLQDGQPKFITETATGTAYYASALEIARSLRTPLPPLVFLSGCRTGQAANQGAVPSMAQQLLQYGATAVLGWGQTVLDTDATAAAATLYGSLSRSDGLITAVGETYQTLIQQKARDWHLLRLYVGKTLPEALVKPRSTPGWRPAPRPSMATEFLDPVTQKVKVPTRESFVGRRRPLQQCIRALTVSPDHLAVLIHGMGGLGKSSLAARLCDRLTQFQRQMWQGRIDPQSLVKRLAEALDEADLRQPLQNPDDELRFRLRTVFRALAQQGKPPLLLVLDDFEQNLEAVDGYYRLRPAAAEVLTALMFALEDGSTGHRLILTSRYDFESSHAARIYKQPLDALQGADLQKSVSS